MQWQIMNIAGSRDWLATCTQYFYLCCDYYKFKENIGKSPSKSYWFIYFVSWASKKKRHVGAWTKGSSSTYLSNSCTHKWYAPRWINYQLTFSLLLSRSFLQQHFYVGVQHFSQCKRVLNVGNSLFFKHTFAESGIRLLWTHVEH